MAKNNSQNNLKLQQTVRFFETLLRASADGIVITDPGKNIIFVNDTFCTFFSRKRQDVLETNLFIWLENLDHNAKDIWKGLEKQINEYGIAKDVEFASKNGEGMRYFSVNSSLLEKIDIEEKGLIISIWRDDTERKMAKEALQKAHDELEMRVEERTVALEESEAKYRRLFEYSNDIIVHVDRYGKVLAINNKLEEVFGYKPEDIIGKYFFSIGVFRLRDLPRVIRLFKDTLRKGMNRDDKGKLLEKVELELRDKNGNFISVETSTTVLKRDGKIDGFLTSVRDITERKRAAETLQSERDNLVRIFEAMIDGVYIVDQKYDIHYVNHVLEKDFGPYKGRKCFEYFHDRTQSCPWCKNEDVFAGKTVNWEWSSSKNDKIYDLIDTPLINPDGTIYKLEIFRDITQRKKIEKALQESEEKFKYVFDHSVAGKSLTLLSGEINVNRALCQMLGYSAQELKNRKWQEITHPDDVELTRNWMNVLISGEKQAVRFNKRFINKNGSIIWTDVGSALRRDKDGKPLYFITTIIDITQRILAEEEIRKSEESLKEAQRLSHIGSWQWTIATDTVKWSEELYHINGLDPNSPAPSFAKMSSCYTPQSWKKLSETVAQTLQSGKSYELDLDVVRPDGTIVHTYARGEADYDASGKITGLHGTVQDITERKHAEKILQARNRMVEYSVSHSLDELLQKTLDEIEALTGSHIGFYHFLEPDQRTIILQTWSTKTLIEMCTAQGKGQHYDISKAGVWVDCCYQRRPVIHNDYSGLEHRKGLPKGHVPVIRELVVPIFQGDLIMAIIGVGNKQVDYNEKDVETVRILAYLGWDLVERKRAEEELLKSKALLNETQKIARIGGGEYDVITGKMTWTDEIYRIYGVNPDDYDPNNVKNDIEFFTDWDKAIMERAFKKAIEEGEPYDLDLKFRNAQGKDMWVRNIGRPEYRDGRVVRIHGYIMDITDSLAAQEQNLMLKHSMDVFYDGIYWLDIDNKFIYVNDAGCRIFGYSREELMTMKVYEVNPRATEQGMKLVWEQLRKKGFFAAESVHRRKDGTEFPVEIRSTYVQFGGREYIGGYARDLSEQKRAEKERIQLMERELEARTEAEAARKLDNMKSMFLASTSHELRTPLNSVIGFSSLLLEGCFGQLNTEQKEQLEIVHSSGKHLLTLINDIIDISKIEAGNINLNVSEFKLGLLVDEVVSMLRVSLCVKKLDLKVNVQDIVMKSDRTRLLQCIMNLLSNAIKYTENGSVEITAKVINSNVIITVTDTGIGIETNDIPKIFSPFVRLQTPLTYKTSGTGLGLYMVKKIAKDFLGGDVEVESEFGKGSKFTLHVPVEIEAQSTQI